MTRFARARGSKSSNERTEEDATNWGEFKRQLEEKKQANVSPSNGESAAKAALKRIKHGTSSQVDTDWADFGVPQISLINSQEKSLKKKKKSVSGSEINIDVPVKKKKKLSEEDLDEDSSVGKGSKKKQKNFTQSVEEMETTSKKKHKKKSKDCEESETPKKKRKSLDDAIETETQVQQKSEEVLNDFEVVETSVSKKKKKKKQAELSEETSTPEETLTFPQDPSFSHNSNKKTKKNKGKNNDNKALGESSFSTNGQESTKPCDKPNAPPFKRRKPYVESSTIHINGATISVTKYDGFDVKTEDAVRLKELRSKMLKEGIPRPEVDKVMKLERRKAEKALAREKKKVCFNCRKSGHLLSECPEVGSSFPSRSFDSGADKICYKCGSTEHTHFQCQVKKKKEYSYATCFICKEQGHISSQCPDNPRGLYPQGGCCKICGEVTHLKKDCPQLSQEKTENTVTLDTFASNSNVESLGGDIEVSKKEKQPVVKSKKIIKF